MSEFSNRVAALALVVPMALASGCSGGATATGPADAAKSSGSAERVPACTEGSAPAYDGEVSAWREQRTLMVGGGADVSGSDPLGYSIRIGEPAVSSGDQVPGGQTVFVVNMVVGDGPRIELGKLTPGRDFVLAGPDGVCKALLECEVQATPCTGTASLPGFTIPYEPEEHAVKFELPEGTTKESLADYSLFVINADGAAVARFATGNPAPTTRPADQCPGVWEPAPRADELEVMSPTPGHREVPIESVPFGQARTQEVDGRDLKVLTVSQPTLEGEIARFTIRAGGVEDTSGIDGSSIRVRDREGNICPLASFDRPANANSLSRQDGRAPFTATVGSKVAPRSLSVDAHFGWEDGTHTWRWAAD